MFIRNKKKITTLAIILSVATTFGISLNIKNENYEKKLAQLETKEHLKVTVNTRIEKKELIYKDYSVFYYVSGNAHATPIVFLHAAYSDHSSFDKQVDFFSKDYKVITIDMIGHGLSKRGKTKDRIDETVNHIEEILKIEKCTGTHLVGVSVGSLVAQYFALKCPDKTLSVTVLGGYDINRNNDEVNKSQRSEFFIWMFKAFTSMNSFRQYVAKKSVYTEMEQSRFYLSALGFERKSFSVLYGLRNILVVRKDVSIKKPILILCGAFDVPIAITTAKKWHNDQANTQFSIINNAGHCANMDNADDFNQQVISFIEKTK